MSNQVLKWAARLLIPAGVAALELGTVVYHYTIPTWTTETMILWSGAALFLNYILIMTLVVPKLARR
jgi:hypothetical protein